MIRRMSLPMAALVGAVTCVTAPLALAKDTTTTLSPAQLEKAAALDIQSGNWPRAEALAQALLTRNPKDVTAHLMRSRALVGLGRFADARDAANAAWRNATTKPEKYNAALLMAQALSSDEKRTRAQWWLRRAVQNAPSEGHAKRARQDFRYVQRRNPWQTYLSFTFAPNSNINNGSARDSYLSNSVFDHLLGGGPQLRPINPEARALSGLEVGAQVQTRYRFAQSERRAHDLQFGLSYRTYMLSSSSKSDVHDASGSDYAFGAVSLGYTFKQLRKDGRGELNAGAEIGQLFYDGARYSSYLRATAEQSYYVSAKTKLRFGLTAETENGQRVSDSESLSVSFNFDRALANGDGLNLGVTLAEQQSPNTLHEYSEARLRSGYLFGREVMGASVQIGLEAKLRDYDAHLLSIEGRRDLAISADVSATFRQIDYYGFNPRMTLSASKTNSNIGVYDSNRLGLSIGIASAF